MKNRIILLVLPLFLILGLLTFVLPQKIDSSLERRALSNNNDLKNTSIIDYSFQNKLDDILNDQFIIRDNTINIYNNIINSINNIVDKGFIMYPNEVLKVNDYLMDPIVIKEEDKIKLIKNRAYNIKQIKEKYPEIPLLVYKPTRLEETNLIDKEYIYSYGNDYNNHYTSEAGDIIFKQMEIDSIDTFEKYFYKTDVHWNPYGAYQGYTDIITTLNDYFDLGDMKEINEYKCLDKDFHGSFSNKIGQSYKPEKLCDITLKGIGEYTYYEDNEIVDIDNIKQYYINGIIDTRYSDYDNYFGNNPFERRFEFENNTNVNALFFVDSYINVNKTWLASHFDTTIMLDMRSKPDDFNLDEYIKKYNIDTIVVSMYHYNLYENGYNFIPIK